MWEVAAIVGALVGAVHSFGEHGIIPAWGGKADGKTLPPLMRFALGAVLMAALAYDAETWQGFLLVGLVAVGAAKMAELLTSGVIELVRGY
jgi:hypothetical protein